MYTGCPLSLAQMGAMWLTELATVGRDSANNMCNMIKSCLPHPNIFPRSIHILKKVIGVDAASKYTYHVCVNDCHTWDWLPEPEWNTHRQDACPDCGSSRFKVMTADDPLSLDIGGMKEKLVPRKVRKEWYKAAPCLVFMATCTQNKWDHTFIDE